MVDIPLLKVVGGASIAELAEEASERLSSAVIPLVKPLDGSATSHNDGPSRSGSPVDTSSASIASRHEDVAEGTEIAPRQVPLSLTQEYSWKLLKQLPEDPTIFHNTIGVFMKGSVDLDRLETAIYASLRRHDIFRTAFLSEGKQTILATPSTRVRFAPVANRPAAEEAYKQLESQEYDLDAGEGLKIVDFHWGQEDHLLVICYHRLVGDGSTTQNLLDEVGQLYNGAKLPPPPQYADFAIRQRFEIQSGQMDADIAYWTGMYEDAPAPLPVLSLPHAQKERGPGARVAWKQHTGQRRLSAVLAFRIRERCKKLTGVTPMHFYLGAYHVLLARLSGAADHAVAIGIADANRASLRDVATMGFFANVLPVRMGAAAGCLDPVARTFADELDSVKERLREALKHSRVPCGIILDRLGIESPAAVDLRHAPLFQAVFDYRQGAAETGRLGGAAFTEIWASRERTPHDVVLEMSDDPAKEPLLTVKLQSYLYGEEDPKAFLDAYESLLTRLSENTKLPLSKY